MWKIDLSKSLLAVHERYVGRPILDALSRLAGNEPITWEVGGSKKEKVKREKERDTKISLLSDTHAQKYFQRISNAFEKERLLVANPKMLLEFAQKELSWRDELERLGGMAVAEACYIVIGKIFNYNSFVKGCLPTCKKETGLIQWSARAAKGAKWSAWHFINSLNVRYCPYCNAETVGNAALKTSNGVIRLHQSELDHFIPQGEYPLLSLSIYNLVPSCSRCNSRFKQSYDPVPEYVKCGAIPILHPYSESIHDYVRFEYAPKSVSALFPQKGNDKDNPIVLYAVSGKRKTQAEEYLRRFHIGEVYRDFYDEELAANIRIAAQYSPIMRRALNKKYKGITTEEIDKVLFRASSDPRQINRSRFAKAIIDLRMSMPTIRRESAIDQEVRCR